MRVVLDLIGVLVTGLGLLSLWGAFSVETQVRALLIVLIGSVFLVGGALAYVIERAARKSE